MAETRTTHCPPYPSGVVFNITLIPPNGEAIVAQCRFDERAIDTFRPLPADHDCLLSLDGGSTSRRIRAERKKMIQWALENFEEHLIFELNKRDPKCGVYPCNEERHES